MTTELDTKLKQLKTLEDNLTALTNEKETLRAEVFSIIETENIGQYKNDFATVSKVERKTVKYLVKPEELINQLPEKYVEVVPEEIIPEHKQIKADLERDVKNGIKIEGVNLEIKESLTIRF